MMRPLPSLPSPSPPAPASSRTWAEISADALRQNCAALHTLVTAQGGPNARLMAVVKADAYGHGAAYVARQAQAAGVEHFGVATVQEVGELRQAGIRGDIYLLGNFLPHEAELLVRVDAVPMLSSPEQWHALCESAQHAPLPARAFLMVDTGMGREGMLPPDARALWLAAAQKGNVRLTGIATHFSSADEPDSDDWTHEQAQAYGAFVRSLPPETLTGTDDGRGGHGVWLTLCNSPATLGSVGASERSQLPPGAVRGTLFRAGLLLYGIEPFRGALADLPDLRPVLSWRARVTLVRDLPPGATVGYGRTATLHRPSRIATVAAGYADGLSRRLGSRGHVLIGGQPFPLVGRISMDQCQADITDARQPVNVGDVATLLGTDGDQTQTVLDLAELVETTPHEPTCLITRRVPRLPRP